MSGLKIIIIFLSLSVVLVFLFFIPLYIIQKKTKSIIKIKPNHYSKIRIDTKNKLVYMNPVKKDTNFENEVYSLDDFIYMISITPDSKDLRELFKLIVNGRSEKVILDKIAILKDIILFTFEREGEKKSYATFFPNSSPEKIDNLYFEMSETFISSKDKEIKIFKNEVSLVSDEKIFDSLYKDIKALKSKGWVIVKISYKNKILPTQKARKSRIIESNKIKSILETKGIVPYISQDFSIFASFKPGTATKNQSSLKKFNIYVRNLLMPTKEFKQEIDIKKFFVTTIYDDKKTQASLNFNLIKLQLISELKYQGKYNDTIYSSVFEEAKIIANTSTDILSKFKNKKSEMEFLEIKIQEDDKHSFNEYFLNIDSDLTNKVLVFPWQNKSKIIKEIINYVNNDSKKTTKRYSFYSFNASLINEIIEAIDDIKRNNNFLILIEDRDNYFDDIYLKEKINIIKEKGFDVILRCDSLDRRDLSRMMLFKPKYILFENKLITDLGNHNIAIDSFKNTMKTKSKHTKIFTIK